MSRLRSGRGGYRRGGGLALRVTAVVLAAAAAAALLAAAAPASLIAAGAAGAGWLRGWPPRRLYGAALWCGPMVAVWLAVTAVRHPGPLGVLASPYRVWPQFWRLAAAGRLAAAAVTVAPAALPLGLAGGGLAWSYRIRAMTTGAGGTAPDSAAAFGARQWRHQAAAARARIAAPGSVPLTTRRGDLVAGAVIRSVGQRAGPLARLPYPRMRAHQVVIGTSGSGKTTLIPLLTMLLPRLRSPCAAMTRAARLANRRQRGGVRSEAV